MGKLSWYQLTVCSTRRPHILCSFRPASDDLTHPPSAAAEPRCRWGHCRSSLRPDRPRAARPAWAAAPRPTAATPLAAWPRTGPAGRQWWRRSRPGSQRWAEIWRTQRGNENVEKWRKSRNESVLSWRIYRRGSVGSTEMNNCWWTSSASCFFPLHLFDRKCLCLFRLKRVKPRLLSRQNRNSKEMILKTRRQRAWRLYVEQYRVRLHHTEQGECNLSRKLFHPWEITTSLCSKGKYIPFCSCFFFFNCLSFFLTLKSSPHMEAFAYINPCHFPNPFSTTDVESDLSSKACPSRCGDWVPKLWPRAQLSSICYLIPRSTALPFQTLTIGTPSEWVQGDRQWQEAR